jgi:hypothetical protein
MPLLLRLQLNKNGNKLTFDSSECKPPEHNASATLIRADTIPEILQNVTEVNDFDNILALLRSIHIHNLEHKLNFRHENHPQFLDHDFALKLCFGYRIPFGASHRDTLSNMIQFVESRKRYYHRPESQTFYDALEALNQNTKALTNDAACVHAAEKAEYCYAQLKNFADEYFDNEKNPAYYRRFQNESLKVINDVRPELEKHRGYKQILGNITLGILGLGVVYGLACVINKAVTGNYLFFKTASANILNNLESSFKKIAAGADRDPCSASSRPPV